jgi:hypothetical protein
VRATCDGGDDSQVERVGTSKTRRSCVARAREVTSRERVVVLGREAARALERVRQAGRELG